MNKLLGEAEVTEVALKQMREIGGGLNGGWAAFQNHDLGSAGIGDLRFLRYGTDCTFENPPEKYPDTKHGIGWRYLLVGKVNLETGKIEELE